MKHTLFMFTLACALLVASCAPAVPVMSNPEVATVLPAPEIGTVLPAVISREGGGTPSPFPTFAPPTAVPALASGLSPTELKYRLLAEYPNFFFCDPDSYPIARDINADVVNQRFPEIQANAEEFKAILAHNGLAGVTAFTDEQKLLIYQEYKKLNAIDLSLAGDHYQFQLRISDNSGQGYFIKGTIDGQGVIEVSAKTLTRTSCPICLAAHTLIDTPRGPVAVENLRLGDSVWTVDAAGRRIAVPILKLGSVPAPLGHEMVHVVLDDARELWASPGHPTADGRRMGILKVGDLLDGGRIILLERVPYDQPRTYDLLPSGATGFYWADGILMGSTLASE